MKVKGIHYGLTLLYSYLLPAVEVEERADGFKFRFERGLARGLECEFRESLLETTCTTSTLKGVSELNSLLGIEKHYLFTNFCKLIGLEDCIANHVSLIFDPRYKRVVAYSVYLSRNTDYYVNTINWVKEALDSGRIESSSYIAREFNEFKGSIDRVLGAGLKPREEAVELMKVRGFGVKLAKAYLLHSYGLTEHSPIDRHYASFFGLGKRSAQKARCISKSLECELCKADCPYYLSTKRFGVFSGVVQSLTYIHGKLVSKRRTPLERVLIRDADYYVDKLDNILERASKLLSTELTSG